MDQINFHSYTVDVLLRPGGSQELGVAIEEWRRLAGDATAFFPKPHGDGHFPEKESGDGDEGDPEQDTDLPHRIVHQHITPASACAEQSSTENNERADRQRVWVRGFAGGRHFFRRDPRRRREIYCRRRWFEYELRF